MGKKLNFLNFDTAFETLAALFRHALSKWFKSANGFVQANTLNYTQGIIFKHFKIKMAPVIGFAGYSGSGKTTLLEHLIPLLKSNGLRIGLVKHSHHDIDPDKPGKDSYRLRHAGCNQTLLATKARHMLYFEYPEPEREEPQLDACLAQLDHSQLDLILVEGFRDEPIAKIEVHRPSYGKPLFYPQDKNIIAFASDKPAPEECPLPYLDLNSPQTVADFIVHWLQED